MSALRMLIAAGVLAVALAAPARAGQWHTDFAVAEAEAKRTDRPMLVHFFATWCGPCKQMDREVLHTPDVMRHLGREIVGVMLDTAQVPDLVSRFGVESIPTDVFLTPDGRKLGEMNGYRPKDDYLRRVVAVEGQYERIRRLHLVSSGTPDAGGPRLPTLDPRIDPPAGPPERPGTPGSGPSPAPAGPASPLRVRPRADGAVLLGLKGFSPVGLYESRKWSKGDPRFAWEHQGLTYLMSSEDELRKFQRDSERYAPRLLGCDPVLYFDEGRAVPGSTQHAAMFDDGLYLFNSPATRAKFRESPERYTKRRTVLLIDEIELAGRGGASAFR